MKGKKPLLLHCVWFHHMLTQTRTHAGYGWVGRFQKPVSVTQERCDESKPHFFNLQWSSASFPHAWLKRATFIQGPKTAQITFVKWAVVTQEKDHSGVWSDNKACGRNWARTRAHSTELSLALFGFFSERNSFGFIFKNKSKAKEWKRGLIFCFDRQNEQKKEKKIKFF